MLKFQLNTAPPPSGSVARLFDIIQLIIVGELDPLYIPPPLCAEFPVKMQFTIYGDASLLYIPPPNPSLAPPVIVKPSRTELFVNIFKEGKSLLITCKLLFDLVG